MKFLITIPLIVLCAVFVLSQNVPNGDFEHSDQYPTNWIYSPLVIIGVPIYGAELTTESHAGDFAVQLGSTDFSTIGNKGWIRTGNYLIETETGDWAFPYTQRPENLKFHYKFEQGGNDSAYVKCMFFNYDSITPGLSTAERIDTIAFSSNYIHEDAENYTEFILPINYYSEDQSEFVSIYFSTSKTISESADGNTPPPGYSYPGTLFWIDDVKFTGGSLSVDSEESEKGRFIIYPNPIINSFSLNAQALKEDIQAVIVRDSSGRLVKQWSTVQTAYAMNELARGLYIIEVKTPSAVFTQRVITE